MEQNIQVIHERQEQQVPVLRENVVIGGTEELFYVNINDTATQADKTSTEIFEATQEGKFAVGVYYYNDAFNVVPFAVIEENIAKCQILFDTDAVQISIDNTGAVTANNISLARSSDIPTQTSQLYNNSGYITNAVSDLANYYLKDETYTKAEVQQLIAQIPSMSVVVVQELPATGEALTIYLVPKNPSQTNNYYDEYMWLTNGWEKIGDTQIDLTDYVKNTDYATSSKGGVIKTAASYGTYTNTNSGYMSADIKTYSQYTGSQDYIFLSKGTLENVITGKELVNQTTLEESQALQDTQINANKDAIDEITVDKLKFNLKGNTYQETTTGKNLIDIDAGINSVMVKNNNQYTITKTSSGRFAGDITVSLTAGDYIWQYNMISNNLSTYGSGNKSLQLQCIYQDNTSITYGISEITTGLKSRTITFEKNVTTIKIYMDGDFTNGASITFDDFMISTNGGDYEQYTGGIASPNPDYPQDIQVVTGDNQIDISNKNLLNVTTLTTGKWLSQNGSENNRENAIISDYIKVKGSVSYTFTNINVSSSTNYITVTEYDKDKNRLSGKEYSALANTNFNRTIETGEDCRYLKLSIYDYNYTTNNQLEEGSTATSYVEHQEQNYPISLGTIELCKIGDYQDYIHKDNDKWYKHSEIGKVVLDGSEDEGWALDSTNKFRTSYTLFSDRKYFDNSITGLILNYYTVATTGNTYYARWRGANEGALTIFNKDILTASDFTTWLSTHNTKVYYVLATPTETEITDTTLLSQLEALAGATSYGENIITQTNYEMPFDMTYTEYQQANVEQVNDYAGIIVPDTTKMTPIKTIEYDVSSNAYFKFMSVLNNFTSMDDQYGACLFRITVTGTNIAKNIIEGIYSIRQGENSVPYFAVRNNAGAGTANSAITGIRYIRVSYPKEMNNGYNYDLEFNCINNNTRHIKIEIFKTTPNITWYDSLTSTTYNSTYQTTTSLTISTTNVINVLGSYTMTVSNATAASYLNSYLPKFLSGTLPSAGEAISAQQFIFISDDNLAYPSSNKIKPIKTGIGIQLCSNNVNLNSTVPNTGLRQKYNNATLTNIPHATLTNGDECWFRCTMDANGNILSDDYIDTVRTPGYTWYFVGMATSSSAINTDTTQSKFYTLDANGILTHIDGIPLAQNGNGVQY